MTYFVSDLAMHRLCAPQPPFAVGVFERRPGGLERRPLGDQVGVAFVDVRTESGAITWSPEVRGGPVPGKFIIDDGRFRPVDFGAAGRLETT
jgi:hypothetical protein